jgi:hypothetical protein
MVLVTSVILPLVLSSSFYAHPLFQTTHGNVGTQLSPISQIRAVGDMVTSGASKSNNPHGHKLTDKWAEHDKASSINPVSLQGADTSKPSLILSYIPSPLTHTFQLIANDGRNDSDPAIVHVTITPQLAGFVLPTGPSKFCIYTLTVDSYQVPRCLVVADAGKSQNVSSGGVVTLHGSDSYGPEGVKLTYSWTQISGIDGVPIISLSGANTPTPTFTAPSVPIPTTATFWLTVNDGKSEAASVTSVRIVP